MPNTLFPRAARVKWNPPNMLLSGRQGKTRCALARHNRTLRQVSGQQRKGVHPPTRSLMSAWQLRRTVPKKYTVQTGGEHIHLIEHAHSKVAHVAFKSSTAAKSSSTNHILLQICHKVSGEIFLTTQYIRRPSLQTSITWLKKG